MKNLIIAAFVAVLSAAPVAAENFDDVFMAGCLTGAAAINPLTAEDTITIYGHCKEELNALTFEDRLAIATLELSDVQTLIGSLTPEAQEEIEKRLTVHGFSD